MNMKRYARTAGLAALLLALNAGAAEVPKDRWLSLMETALPAAFCQAQMYFRQCFTVSARECEEVAASVTRTCLRKYQDQMPAQFQQPDDGTRWGSTVGACAGEAYEVVLVARRANTARCNDPDNWR